MDEREDRRDRPDEDEENDPQRDAGEAPPRQEVCPGHGGGEHDGPDPDTEQLQDDLFAKFEVTEQVDLKRLQTLLRDVRGPSQLADNPSAYAWEWTRLEELDAERPPFVPQRVWSWYRNKDRTVPQRSG